MNHKIIRIALAFVFVALLTAFALTAQTTATADSTDRVALYQALLDLQNPWTVMCVAAHPDDEDGTSLVVMRHKYGAHTVSLFSTFGEGGQNAIGPELYDELGAIRARETMAAAEIQGSEPYFLGLKDFGFSKTRDEAFRFWGHEEALRRMVLQIRKLRPDVIITNHSTTSNDHGQHQATALMVVEAFDAAADATKFPEQLKDGVTTWQVQRLFVRARGNQQQTSAQLVTIDPNEKDPVRGTVFAEEALHGLQQHATQGPWPKSFEEYRNRFRAFSGQNAPTGQLPMIRYALVKSVSGGNTLPTDSHNFLDGLQLPAQVANESAVPTLTGSLLDLSANREQAFAQLVEGFKHGSYGHVLARPVDPARRARMKERVEQAMALAAGINLDVKPSETTVVPGSVISLSVRDANETKSTTVRDCSSWIASRSETPSSNGKLKIPADASINTPLSRHLYEPNALGLEIDTRCTVEASGAKFSLDRVTRVDIAPPIEIDAISNSPIVTTPANDGKCGFRAVDFKLRVTNHLSDSVAGELTRFPTLGPIVGRGNASRTIAVRPRESAEMAMPMDGCELSKAQGGITFMLSATQSKITPGLGVPVVIANARVTPDLRVGYIRGFDFSLPNALNALGVESKELSVDDVKMADLSKFTSVIVDNRVYESKPELIAANQRLLDYANAGGNLIVFYHKSDEWNPDERRNRPQLAPYKLILGGERVTDENAPITFIEPDHPLLNTPNKMGQDDFKDWIQERGLYYPKEWDPQFHALLQSNDPGENPLKGGLLVADYGKGHYIYTSMVWYRELRGGIPGAYRMLANMISYGRN
jgi:LmbE family N-acetylglucosaminyl deacetylase